MVGRVETSLLKVRRLHVPWLLRWAHLEPRFPIVVSSDSDGRSLVTNSPGRNLPYQMRTLGDVATGHLRDTRWS